MAWLYFRLSFYYAVFVLFLILMFNSSSVRYKNEEVDSEENQLVAPYISLNTTSRFFQEKMKNRKSNIDLVCKSLHVNETEMNYLLLSAQNRILVNRKHSISWCPIYKAASTVWLTNFLTLSGNYNFDLTKKLSHLVLRIYKKDRTLINYLNQTRKFIIVRHPFQRLLSAYRDKLENRTNREYYYEKFGKHITMLFGSQTSSKTPLREPTFEEFLRFLVHENWRFNEHWRPFYQECAPCAMDYDYIIKLEHFKDENKAFIKDVGLENILDFELEKNGNQNGKTTNQIEAKYFSKIPKSLLEKLYKIYKIDFLLFEYSPNKYFDMAIKNV